MIALAATTPSKFSNKAQRVIREATREQADTITKLEAWAGNSGDDARSLRAAAQPTVRVRFETRRFLNFLPVAAILSIYPLRFRSQGAGPLRRPLLFGRALMRTFVYVDGFNLYYGTLKGTSWKWLDLVALFQKVLQQQHDILKVKYFTARVSGTPVDQSKPQRQDVYLRALQRFRPEVEVYFGHFLRHRVRAPLAQPLEGRRTIEVIKTEEKGSDVNLAVHLLNDGWLDAYDCGVVVSNDSDLAEAMRLVREQHGKRIGLVTPGTGRPSQQLKKHADFARHIRTNGLRLSQLPDPIPGTNIRKPAAWCCRPPDGASC